MEDYYKILGISFTESIEEIKKAHKHAYVKWHPDRAPKGQEAQYEQKCKKINEAYSVLSNPETKQSYDVQMGFVQDTSFVDGYNFSFDEGDFFTSAFGGGTRRQQKHQKYELQDYNISVSISVSLYELYYGRIQKTVPYQRYVNCISCQGTGYEKTTSNCRYCNGYGFVTTAIFGIMKTRTTCSRCEGSGKQLTICRHCLGEAIVKVKHSRQIDIRYSVKDKTVVKLKHAGHQIGQKKGDLLIELVHQIQGAVINGPNLMVTTETTFEEILNRATLRISFLNEVTYLRLPVHITNDQIFEIPAMGLLKSDHSRASLLVKLHYTIPHKL